MTAGEGVAEVRGLSRERQHAQEEEALRYAADASMSVDMPEREQGRSSFWKTIQSCSFLLVLACRNARGWRVGCIHPLTRNLAPTRARARINMIEGKGKGSSPNSARNSAEVSKVDVALALSKSDIAAALSKAQADEARKLAGPANAQCTEEKGIEDAQLRVAQDQTPGQSVGHEAKGKGALSDDDDENPPPDWTKSKEEWEWELVIRSDLYDAHIR